MSPSIAISNVVNAPLQRNGRYRGGDLDLCFALTSLTEREPVWQENREGKSPQEESS